MERTPAPLVATSRDNRSLSVSIVGVVVGGETGDDGEDGSADGEGPSWCSLRVAPASSYVLIDA